MSNFCIFKTIKGEKYEFTWVGYDEERADAKKLELEKEGRVVEKVISKQGNCTLIDLFVKCPSQK